ncbi:hypothetical protein BGZ97_003745 [Linnemannia gamsii]|uniref:F-box domain-containing protein n=1 Tax=Linnemannia gamsii TaxID=64522 RepID=A0A9P6RQS3_9FUNG|nr:hypothetical protein BGZ97_003745 [Linnemannia gamsii]
MPTRTGPSLASVPELLEFIGHHLTLPDLARCTLTCQLWHQALSPLLWQTFDDSLYGWPRIMSALYSEAATGQRDKAWLDALFSRYGHHIRTLRIRWHSTVLAASACGRCTQLISLQSFNFRESLTAGQGKCLDSIRLDMSLSYLYAPRSFDPLDKILSGLLNLVELSNTLYPMDVNLILQQLPSLRSINGAFKLDTSSISFNNIRYFEATMPLNPLTFRQCLVKFPNLDCLCLERLLPLPHPTTHNQQQQQQIVVQDNYHSISYQLQELRFTKSDYSPTLETLQQVLFWLPHLRHITLTTLYKSTADMLVAYCKELESFRLLEDKGFYHATSSFDASLVLLQGCPKLKVLDAVQHQIRAETLLASPPWVCDRLETLRCLIVGVSRLLPQDMKILNDLFVLRSSKNVFLTKQDRNALQMSRNTMGQQQQVLERLASLTHLKVLELAFKQPRDHLRRYGDKNPYVGYFTDTLELTLDSGLGKLAALKDLEMFGFEGCNHLIDRSELDWMIKSWPRLRAMSGLRQNGLLTSSFEMRKADLRSYMRQIRSDIQQHGGGG